MGCFSTLAAEEHKELKKELNPIALLLNIPVFSAFFCG
jgi:hypothetical protein